MDLKLFLLNLLPIVVFVVVDMWADAKTGILAALALSICVVLWSYWSLGSFDPMSLCEAGLILVLGAVSLKLDSSIYFKLQPAVLGIIISLYIAYFQFFDTPLMVRYLPLMSKMNPEMETLKNDPSFLVFLTKASGHFIIVFAVHAAMVLFAALRLSNKMWLAARLMIYPMLILSMLVDKLRYQ